MPEKQVEIKWKNQVTGVPELDSLLKKTREMGDRLDKLKDQNRDAATSSRVLTQSLATTVLEFRAVNEAVTQFLGTLTAITIDSALVAARTQTLGAVTSNLARVNNLSQVSVRAVTESLKAQGITTQESLATVNKMIFAQLDLAKASQIARVAQDAAALTVTSSSQALEGIIRGIVTRQPEVLRTYGIIVNFEAAFAREARKLGRQLTDTEKTQIALNLALKEGAKIAGSYEVAMATTGKRLTSLTREVEEAKNAIGEGFAPALARTVSLMEQMVRFLRDNATGFATLTTSITAASLAAAAFRITPGPPVLKAGVAAAVGLGTFAFAGDPIETIQGQGQSAISTLTARREQLRAEAVGVRNPERLRSFADQEKQIDALIAQIRTQTATELAKVFIQRGKSGGKTIIGEAERLATGVDLGAGVKVSSGEVLQAIQQIRNPQSAISGPIVNQKLLDELNAQALADQFAVTSKRLNEDVAGILRGLRNDGLEPLARLFIEEQNTIEKLRERFKGINLDPQIAAIRSEFAQQRTSLINQQLAEARSRDPRANQRISDLASQTFFGAPQSGVFFVDPEERDSINRRKAEAELEIGRARLEASFQAAEQQREAARQRSIAAVARQAQYEERIVQLMVGPGGQVAAINQIAAMREQAALREFELSKQTIEDRARLEAQVDDARRGRILSILELQRKQLDEFQENAGRLFDSIRSRGPVGIRDFIQGQRDTILRQVFVNTAGLSFETLRKANFQLPGVGTAEKPTLLGKIFAGTPLGPNPLKDLPSVTIQNTSATVANTAALSALQGAILGGGIGSVASGGTFGNLSIPGVPSGVFQGGLGTILSAFPGFGPASTQSNLDSLGRLQEQQRAAKQLSLVGFPAGSSGKSTFAKAIGPAASVGLGAITAVQGLRQGGVAGGVTAAAGVLQAAAAIPGPQQPFVQAGALIAGFIGQILPDPRKVREQTIDRVLEGAKFDAPQSTTREVDLFGRQFDYNTRGEVRIIQNNTFQALDARSLMDRRHDIADLVSTAAADGHPIVQEFRSQIAPV